MSLSKKVKLTRRVRHLFDVSKATVPNIFRISLQVENCRARQLFGNSEQFARRDRGRLSVSSNTTILKQSLPLVIV